MASVRKTSLPPVPGEKGGRKICPYLGMGQISWKVARSGGHTV
jgi:hypothetical protein